MGEGVTCELWWVVLGDEEEHSHGVKVGVGRFTFCEFNGGDAERPDVSLHHDNIRT